MCQLENDRIVSELSSIKSNSKRDEVVTVTGSLPERISIEQFQ